MRRISLAVTATVRANTTTLAHANATSTGQANATTTAQVASTQAAATTQAGDANATMTAQTQLNATATARAANTTATVQAANASATAVAYATAISGIYTTLALDDDLQDNSHGHNWDTAPIAGGGGCAFIANAYHSSMPQTGYFSPCFAQMTAFSDFSYQVQMTIVKGDQGGITFRATAATGSFYYFLINRNGEYAFEIYSNDTRIRTLSQGFSSAINTSLDQPNLIAVIANGNNLDLYVNMQHIASVTDTTYDQGQIGVIAENTGNPTDVVFSNVKVWTR